MLLRKEQDEVVRTEVELAGAVVLQGVETRVMAAAPTQLSGTTAEEKPLERRRDLELFECGGAGLVLRAVLRARRVLGERVDHGLGERGGNICPHATIVAE